MNSAVLTTIAATGFTVAFFHAAIPTHWLPFVLVSRARGWSRGKTLAVSTFAGRMRCTYSSRRPDAEELMTRGRELLRAMHG